MSAGSTAAGNMANSDSNGAWGWARLILSVLSSLAWMSLIALYESVQALFAPLRAMSSETFTSLAFIGVPSENLTPGCRWNVHVSPSALDSHLSASAGSTLKPSLVVRSNVSYTLTEM